MAQDRVVSELEARSPLNKQHVQMLPDPRLELGAEEARENWTGSQNALLVQGMAPGTNLPVGAPGDLHHSKSHPRLLQSNATSHVWPFGALAELLDNAQDAEAGSRSVWVDVEQVPSSTGQQQESFAITVTDDGLGMRQSQVHSMLSYGFSAKEHAHGNVGRCGHSCLRPQLRYVLSGNGCDHRLCADTGSVLSLALCDWPKTQWSLLWRIIRIHRQEKPWMACLWGLQPP